MPTRLGFIVPQSTNSNSHQGTVSNGAAKEPDGVSNGSSLL